MAFYDKNNTTILEVQKLNVENDFFILLANNNQSFFHHTRAHFSTKWGNVFSTLVNLLWCIPSKIKIKIRVRKRSDSLWRDDQWHVCFFFFFFFMFLQISQKPVDHWYFFYGFSFSWFSRFSRSQYINNSDVFLSVCHHQTVAILNIPNHNIHINDQFDKISVKNLVQLKVVANGMVKMHTLWAIFGGINALKSYK